MDPRVNISEKGLQAQTKYSIKCYEAYHQLQDVVEAIDRQVAGMEENQKRAQLLALRGRGATGDPDILYGSIYQKPTQEETLVGLQRKFLFMLNVLQRVDAAPTSQTITGISELEAQLKARVKRWEEVR